MRFTNRILIVDDNIEIHNDFRKILAPPGKSPNSESLEELELAIFDDEEKPLQSLPDISYRLDFAFQGEEAIELVRKSIDECDPYSVIYMDVRMPPGMNGVEAISHIWKIYPLVEIVIVTAYSDYSWEDILQRIGVTDRLMFLRKPFDQVSVKQMTLSLSHKFNLNRHLYEQVEKIENTLKARHSQLSDMLTELKSMH